ncbi:DEAD/DEAH box helicase, partial [Campylobacter jejuni]
ASDFVIMAATRSLAHAKNIIADFSRQADFITSAGFIYTSDQEKACHELLQDFYSGQVMDMLLSREVGFGKTEVPMNAINPVVK